MLVGSKKLKVPKRVEATLAEPPLICVIMQGEVDIAY